MCGLPERGGDMSLLSVENLAVSIGGRAILHSVSLTIEPGEIVTVVGPNGSGKSTLLRAIIGAIPASSGLVRKRKGLRIGYVPQRLHLDTNMPLTVGRFLSLTGRKPTAVVLDTLGQVGLLDLRSQQLSDLSGGQFQRVQLARALLANPDLLLLDEATQGLDQTGTAAFYRLIEEARTAQNCAVLMVSHDLHVVMSASDRVICLNGHICCQGTPEMVSSAPEYRALFGFGSQGALALYRHAHDHNHDHNHAHDEAHDHEHDHPSLEDAR